MNSFVETIAPVAREHVGARLAYFNDVALAVVQSTRQLSEANLQFSRDWLAQSTEAWQKALFTPVAERGEGPVLTAEAVAQKLQAYQRQVAQIASDFQTAITEVSKQHVPQTARTATALAEAVTQKAASEADQQLRNSKTAGKELIEQAARFAHTATQNRAMQEPSSMQSAEGQGNKS
jgi:hypothetical protein